MARKIGSSAGLAHKTVAKPSPTRKQNVSRRPHLDTSDAALADVLKRIKGTADPSEIRRLTDQLERIVFHKQYENA